MDKQVVISVKTILILFVFVLIGYVLYQLGPIIGILLLAALIVISVEPLVKFFMRGILGRVVSRGFAVVLSFGLVLLFLAVAITLVAPPVVSQTQKLIQNSSHILTQFNNLTGANLAISDLFPDQKNVSGTAINFTISVFSNLAEILSLFILSLYMSLDWVNIKRTLFAFFPDNIEDAVRRAFDEIETTVSNWTKGELTLMLVVGVASLVGLEALGVKYPLALALLSGILEIVPLIGPILSALVAVMVALADSPVKALGVMALFIVIQQLENNLLVPKVMQKVSGFSPLIILIALLAGSKFFGVTGAIVAVPMTMVIAILLKRFLNYTV